MELAKAAVAALAEHVFHGLSLTGVTAFSLDALLLKPSRDILKSVEG
jgi:hypothetical protein